uniref:Uncharacterized protein n=1 Tax=Corethron hystrix TaxID=216773 RepID=A0A7S1BH47_9STRA|mmetsp:Transcript_26756/g.61584  ORF Transcript_26756/g.61584 Transcript_26756/m.61584 type:complete len:105 (+) Transcript_26756:71-385(+)
MGNCCGLCPGEENQTFQGEGRRLGSAGDRAPLTENRMADRDDPDPAPVVDPALTEEDREAQRRDRLAAVEARLKKQGGASAKKRKEPASRPLGEGPNMMTWNAG